MKDLSVTFTLKNYRCFVDAQPAKFTLQDDFTAFVGPNNVGKSTLLRFFYEMRSFWYLMDGLDVWMGAVAQEQTGMQLGTGFLDVPDAKAVFARNNDRSLVLAIEVRTEPTRGAPVLDQLSFEVRRDGQTFLALRDANSDRLTGTFVGPWLLDADGVGAVDVEPYAKVIRTLSKDSAYIAAFRHVINAPGVNFYDLPVGHLFVESWRDMTQGDDNAARLDAEALVEEIRSIFGFESLAITPHASGKTLHVRINGETFRLDEVGAGIAHFIICLTFVATRKPRLVFIDEPESNLHPALQLRFLESLARRVPDGVVFATHSIGLVRATGARSYSMRPVKPGQVDVQPFQNPRTLAEQLGELSYSAHQELGFSKVLLVEGSTETAAVRELLRKYGKDAEVVVVSLGGSDGIKAGAEPQLAEVKRICDDVSALIDSEKPSEASALDATRQAFVAACSASGVQCHVLTRRAFENYLPDEAVRSVSPRSRELAPYEKLSNLGGLAWHKSENWRIALEMTREDLEGTDLGAFLEQL